MKKTDNREFWQPAPINGKDVSWDFIIENLEQGDRKVAQDTRGTAALLYVSSGKDDYPVQMICASSTCNIIAVFSHFYAGIQLLLHEICDPINADPDTDLCTVFDEPTLSTATQNFSTVIRFYHTAPNNND